jgi:hypothetical protein
MLQCWHCGAEWPESHKPGRGDECPSCNAALRCCYQCEFYDPAAANECRENQADPVQEKDRANFCDWFRPDPTPTVRKDRAQSSRNKAEDLWKKLTGGDQS